MNLEELLFGELPRLRFVHRYGLARIRSRENVAEHSYFVCLYALAIATWLEHRYEGGSIRVDKAKLLQRAILHDIEECRTDDVMRHVKKKVHDNEPLYAEFCRTEVTHLAVDVLGGITSHAAGEWLDAWENCKDDSYEGRILRFCDLLSVISFIGGELQMGSTGMLEWEDTVKEYVAGFQTADYEFMAPLPANAQAIVEKMFDR